MMSFDWTAVVLGLVIGAATSAVFFVGLRMAVRLAIRSTKPVALLVLSSVIRIAALIGIGWLVAQQGGPWPLMGYAAAFLIVRFIVTTIASVGAPSRGAA